MHWLQWRLTFNSVVGALYTASYVHIVEYSYELQLKGDNSGTADCDVTKAEVFL